MLELLLHPPRAHLTGSLETPAMCAKTEALAAPELAETVLRPTFGHHH